MNIGTVKLKDYKLCNGCPCRVELFFQAKCLLYKLDLLLDDTNFYTVRPGICIEEHGR